MGKKYFVTKRAAEKWRPYKSLLRKIHLNETVRHPRAKWVVEY